MSNFWRPGSLEHTLCLRGLSNGVVSSTCTVSRPSKRVYQKGVRVVAGGGGGGLDSPDTTYKHNSSVTNEVSLISFLLCDLQMEHASRPIATGVTRLASYSVYCMFLLFDKRESERGGVLSCRENVLLMDYRRGTYVDINKCSDHKPSVLLQKKYFSILKCA